MHKQMPNWLSKRAFLTPDRHALEDGHENVTFFELDARAKKTAGKISSLHVKDGDFVALLLENGIHTVEIIHALEYLGAVIVPLNNRLTAAELRFQLEDSGAVLLVYDDTFSEKAKQASQSLDHLTNISYEKLRALPETAVPLKTKINLDSLHTIMYTSGTTGAPKGVKLTYGNHWWSAVGSALNLGNHEHDRWLIYTYIFAKVSAAFSSSRNLNSLITCE